MKDLSVFSLVFYLLIIISLKKLKYCICNSIWLALTIINAKIILEKFQNIIALSKAQTFYIYKTAKIVVINKPENFLFTFF